MANISAFEYDVSVGHNFPSKEQVSFNFMVQSPSAVILEPPKIKSDTISTVSPSVSHEVMGPDIMILVFLMLSFKSTFTLLFHFQ